MSPRSAAALPLGPHTTTPDGLVHKRFPVGPIADLPSMKRIVVAHKLHHSEKYGGVPFGMFFGPQVIIVTHVCVRVCE